MKKKLLPLLLALAVCLSLMPVGVSAAQTDLPDWYFLVAIFKNVDADVTDKDGQTTHVKYTMSQDEIDYAKKEAEDFETAMNSFGVMRAHVDVVEIDTPITEKPKVYDVESYVTAKQVAALLKNEVALDRYDFVFCAADLNVDTDYRAITLDEYENGAGHACVNYWNWNKWSPARMPGGTFVHEFLHFMERMSTRWGQKFALHSIGEFYAETYGSSLYVTINPLIDIILNRAKGEFGTGVNPEVWKHPPHTCWTTHEWTIPSSLPDIGSRAFWGCTALFKINIPSNIATIGESAFQDCINLTEVNLSPGLTSIERFAFDNCTSLSKVNIPSGVTTIGGAAFQSCTSLTSVSLPASIISVGNYAFTDCPKLTDVYYGGTEAQWKAIQIGKYNEALTNANIHYQSKETAEPQKPEETAPAVSFTDVKSSDWFAKPVAWAVEKGITSGTSETTFSPNRTCTHGQIITFLWRAAGSPDPSVAVALKGVNPDVYYYKALQWAVAAEITADGPFYPDAACTRGDTVTYLWKLAGSPSAKAASFADVPSGAACAQAVSWAVEQGVTGGTSETTFSPDKTCTRGQIVTFLYAALA